ncbi:MAG TPA: ankyrin repeat domain-containing protein [Sedimentisphaerales bacterium]|nr:ankyrin repeat domain-containing protein [Sedimentisphaerales bacterium]
MAEFDEDRIVRRLEAISDIDPTAETTQHAMERVRDALVNEGKRPTDSRTGLGGIFWRGRFARLAAAAVIIAAAITGLHYLPGPVGFTAPAFGEVVDNVLSQKWVYMFEEDRKTGQIAAEYWYNPAERKLYAKSHTHKGNAFMLDLNSCEEYEYRHGTLTVRKRNDLRDTPGWLEQRIPMLNGLLTRYEREGADIVQKNAIYNSEAALLYEIEITLPATGGLSTDRYSWLVDNKTHLPIICERTDLYGYERNGKFQQTLAHSQRYAFDYSEKGPVDIYDLGVPSDAPIVDERPTPEMQQLTDNINHLKETKYNSFAAIIVKGGRPERLIIKDGPKMREEYFDLAIGYSRWEAKKEEYLESMGKTFKTIYGWIEQGGILSRQRILLFDGLFSYQTNDWDMEENEPIAIGRRRSTHNEFYSCCWKWMPDGQVVSTAYSREHGLICTESDEAYNYFDPSKDYLWVRHEKKTGGVPYEVAEFARTPSGMWYPHKIRDSEWVTIYAADLNSELVKELDPQSLPNYVDHREPTRQMKIQRQQDPNGECLEYTGFTPLHMAIYRQDFDRVRELLRKGADVEPAYDSGATPMELAVSSGNLEMVKLLFQHGADFISNDSEKRDALGLAVKEGYYEIAEFMLDNGSHVDAVYKNGSSPLHYAAANGDIAMVEMLSGREPRVDARDNQNRTPLYRAIDSLAQRLSYPTPIEEETIQRFKDVITLLIENGADINALNNEKYSAFSRAVKCLVHDSRNAGQQMDFLEFLLELGADPDLDAGRGSNSAFWRAVEQRRYDILTVLLEGGANPWLIADADSPPGRYNLLHCARMKKDDKLYDLLYQYMKDRYEQTNEELLELTAQVVQASLEDDMATIGSICADPPRYRRPWTGWSKQIKRSYQGHESLIDKAVPGWFTVDGLAEVYVPLSEGKEEKSIMLGFIQYPDGQWKCVYYRQMSFMPEYEKNLRTAFISGNSGDEFRNYIYDQAGKRMN